MSRLLSCLALCLLPLAQAAGAHPLLEAYGSAQQQDPALRAARHEHTAARELVEQADGAWRPEIVLSAAASQNLLDQKLGPASRSRTYLGNSVALQWRQPLVNAELESRRAQARARAALAEAQVQVRQLDLALRLGDAYLVLAAARHAETLAREELARQQVLVNAVRRSVEAGESAATDGLEATARLQVLASQLSAAEADSSQALEALASLSGITAAWPTPVQLDARGLPALPGVAQAQWETDALDRHPEMESRRRTVDLAREGVRLARAGHAPRLDWTATLSRGDSESITTLSQVNTLASAGIQLNVPLYEGGRAQSAERQALAMVEKSEAEMDEVRHRLRLEIRQAWRNAMAARQRLQSLEQALDTGQQLLAATRRGVQSGLRSSVDVLTAERQWAQTRREHERAAIDYLRAWWRLQLSRGQVSDTDFLALPLAQR